VFSGDDGCSGSSTVVPRDTATLEPRSGGARLSFSAGGNDPLYRVRLTNPGGSPLDFAAQLRETTLFSTAWSTNGTFNTYYSFQNTTTASIAGTLRLRNTAGTEVAAVPVAILAGATASVNTVSAGAPRSQTGVATFTHDGPPGAVLIVATIANFATTPATVQPVKFESVREGR
ncbi:MAG: hypothetical protein ACRDMZ_11540, partial [Solirubrobacteraceae bacterium]